MARTLRHILLACLLPGAATAWASTPNTGPKPWDSPDEGATPTAVTAALKCRITDVREDRILEVYDEESESKHLIRLAETVSLRARNKRAFGGRKELLFDDLRIGQRIKVTYLTGDGTIVRVKVLETKPVT